VPSETPLPTAADEAASAPAIDAKPPAVMPTS